MPGAPWNLGAPGNCLRLPNGKSAPVAGLRKVCPIHLHRRRRISPAVLCCWWWLASGCGGFNAGRCWWMSGFFWWCLQWSSMSQHGGVGLTSHWNQPGQQEAGEQHRQRMWDITFHSGCHDATCSLHGKICFLWSLMSWIFVYRSFNDFKHGICNTHIPKKKKKSCKVATLTWAKQLQSNLNLSDRR